jgi:hypothetical protein
MHPALRQDIPHRACEGLKTLARTGILQTDDGVEKEMAFVQCIVRPGHLDRAAPVLIEEFRNVGRFC